MPIFCDNLLDCYHLYINYIDAPKRVIFNDPATIVYWNDGTKTVVKCHPEDTFNKEVGLLKCIAKKVYHNNGSYNDILRKWCDTDKKKEPVKKTTYKHECESHKESEFDKNKQHNLEIWEKRIDLITESEEIKNILSKVDFDSLLEILNDIEQWKIPDALFDVIPIPSYIKLNFNFMSKHEQSYIMAALMLLVNRETKKRKANRRI